MVQEEATDETLMQAYQNGNNGALEVLYRRHSAKVYGFLRKKLKNQALVDDVFQATFMKLHKSRSHYDPSFPFIPWLFTVCRSAMLDSLRKKERIQEDLNETAVLQAEAPVDEISAASDLPDMSQLPQPQREALELRYKEDLSFEEIAKRLETSPANARQLVSRAIKRLKGMANLGRNS